MMSLPCSIFRHCRNRRSRPSRPRRTKKPHWPPNSRARSSRVALPPTLLIRAQIRGSRLRGQRDDGYLVRTLTVSRTQLRVRIDLCRFAGCGYWVQAGFSPSSLKALPWTAVGHSEGLSTVAPWRAETAKAHNGLGQSRRQQGDHAFDLNRRSTAIRGPAADHAPTAITSRSGR
jgi:hypothetical protein